MRFLVFALALACAPALALTPSAQEFLEISKTLEPVQCEKRQLRRAMAMARVEERGEDMKRLQARFAALNKDPKTTKLEKRLAELESRILDGSGKARDPQDLEAISLQQRQAFYRCE
ncbi:MAG: hypothetical protein ACT4P9_10810 [Betaproteobacteria bacterium]